MPYNRFTPEQLAYLHQCYRHQPARHFAALWGVAVDCIHTLAKRRGLAQPRTKAPLRQASPPVRLYHSFTAQQVAYLRRHYTAQPAHHFVEKWGISLRQLYELAHRHGIRKRAPNGQPVWRDKTGAWGEGSRWAG